MCLFPKSLYKPVLFIYYFSPFQIILLTFLLALSLTLDHILFFVFNSSFCLIPVLNCNLNFKVTTIRWWGGELARCSARCLTSISLIFPTSLWTHWSNKPCFTLYPQTVWQSLELPSSSANFSHSWSKYIINQTFSLLHSVCPKLEGLPLHIPL